MTRNMRDRRDDIAAVITWGAVAAGTAIWVGALVALVHFAWKFW